MLPLKQKSLYAAYNMMSVDLVCMYSGNAGYKELVFECFIW